MERLTTDASTPRPDKKHPWLKLGDHRGVPWLLCERCGQDFILTMPASFGMLGAVLRQFVKDHCHCHEDAAPPETLRALSAWARQEICDAIANRRDDRL